MPVENTLPPLSEDPRDVQGSAPVGKADEVIYRLGLHCLQVPGLPETMRIDNVDVSFLRGPVRAQQTNIRQRHGLPVVFDKHMTRVEVGTGETIALFAISSAPVPGDLSSAFERWRARALAAAGLVAAVLDERVTGRELFEDAVLLRKGRFVGAADMRGLVRTYLPFDVNEADRSALEQLESISLSEASDVTRAARLYRRAALEGPTADAYAMLWVAAECFSGHRSPSRKDIEAALVETGLDPAGLPLHVGHLIDLRGKVQHHGLEDDDRLKTAYYEMEAVVRSLIRHKANLRGGWWPASDNAAGFAEPFNHVVAALQRQRTATWHRQNLPEAEEPKSTGIPRRVSSAARDPRLELDPQLGDDVDFIAGLVVDALEWHAPNARLEVRVGLPPATPSGITLAANPEAVWLAPDRLDNLDRPGVIANLAWDLHASVVAALVQRAGLASEGPGAMLIEAMASWAQYQRFVKFSEFDASLLQIPTTNDPYSLGKLAGWAAAGDKRAAAAIKKLGRPDRKLVGKVVKNLRTKSLGPSTDLLDLAVRSGALVEVPPN